ncbi:MAG: hypothetical protein ACAH80_01970 [Alphaproteobacteria bacterium]
MKPLPLKTKQKIHARLKNSSRILRTIYLATVVAAMPVVLWSNYRTPGASSLASETQEAAS